MNKTNLLLISLSFLLFSSLKCSESTDYTEVKTKTMAAATQIEECQQDKQRDEYWLKVGLRERYDCIKGIMGISALELLAGEPVFKKGPHGKELNLSSQNEFGHYNPAFLNKVAVVLEETMKDAKFKLFIKTAYETHLQATCRIYYLSYDQPTEEIIKEYKELLANAEPCENFGCEPSMFLQESFRDFAEDMEKKGHNAYEGFTAPGFWVRRNIDGTAPIFYKLLKQFMGYYDADFIK